MRGLLLVSLLVAASLIAGCTADSLPDLRILTNTLEAVKRLEMSLAEGEAILNKFHTQTRQLAQVAAAVNERKRVEYCTPASSFSYCPITYSAFSYAWTISGQTIAQVEAIVEEAVNSFQTSGLNDTYCQTAFKNYACATYFPKCDGTSSFGICQKQCIDLFGKCATFYAGASGCSGFPSETEGCTALISQPELSCAIPPASPSRYCKVTWPTILLPLDPEPRLTQIDDLAESFSTTFGNLITSSPNFTATEAAICTSALSNMYCQQLYTQCTENSPYTLRDKCTYYRCADFYAACPRWLEVYPDIECVSFLDETGCGEGSNNKLPASIQGDPHFDTFDQASYSFQGLGEFVWITSSSPNFAIQVRLEPCSEGSTASCPTAFAFSLGGVDYTVEKLEDGGVKVIHSSDGTAVTLPITAGAESMKLDSHGYLHIVFAVGLTVEGQGFGNRITMTARPTVYPDGWTTLQGKFQGLAGKFDGIRSNDFTLKNGTALVYPPSERDIANLFGESWRISAGESLFHYGNGATYDHFNNVTAWEPFYWDESNVQLPDFITAACADLSLGSTFFQCVFDLWLTNDTSYVASAAGLQSSWSAYLDLVNGVVPQTPSPIGTPASASTLVASSFLILSSLIAMLF